MGLFNKFEGMFDGGESPEQENNKEREYVKFKILTKLEAVAAGGMRDGGGSGGREGVHDDERVASEAKKLMDEWKEKMGDEEYEKLEEEVWSGFSLRHGPEVVKETRVRVEGAQEEDENEGLAAAA